MTDDPASRERRQEIARVQAEVAAMRRAIDNKPKPRRPKRLAQALSVLMAQRGYANIDSNEALRSAWRQVAGPLASLTQVWRLRGGTLEIIASSSMAVQELTFQKQHLLQLMQTQAPEARIRDLKVRQGVF